MKTWAEMTERERDVLVAKALGWEVVEVAQSQTFKTAQEKNNWYPVTTHRYAGTSVGFLPGTHWTRNGEKIDYGRIYKGEMEDRFGAWPIPRFSTDRAAAMTLLDGVEAWSIIRMFDGTYDVSITSLHASYSETGNSLPEAICRAFLRAKGINIE